MELNPGDASAFLLVNYTDYDAYGNAVTASGGSQNAGGLSEVIGSDQLSDSPFGFGGGYLDGSGLYYFIDRYYSSNIGQFLSLDPAVQMTGTPYAYAGDNPTGATDPLGDWWCMPKGAYGPCVRGYTPGPPYQMPFPPPPKGSSHSEEALLKKLEDHGIDTSAAAVTALYTKLARANLTDSRAIHLSMWDRAEADSLHISETRIAIAARVIGVFATGYFEWESTHSFVKTVGATAGAAIRGDVGAAVGAIVCGGGVNPVGDLVCGAAGAFIGAAVGGWVGSFL